jgi:phytoene dehydrogenase-like protein
MDVSHDLTRRELLGAATAAAGAALAAGQEPGKRADQPADAIFIGAGINSLGAALRLSKAGWRVVVLDRNREPGGAIRTQELTLPGFRHDIGPMNLTVFANSPFYKEHAAELTRKGVVVLTANHPYGSVFSGGRFLGITTNLEANLRLIAAFSGADAEAWKAWDADFDRCAPILFRILGSPPAPARPLEYVFGESALVPEAARSALSGILLDSLRDNLSTRFESDAVRALVAAWGLHIDYAPDVAGGCWMPFLETNVDQRLGISLIQGGSGRLIDALVDLIRDTGGEVRCGQTVERVLIEGGRAVGVRLAGGEVVRCTRAVVASVTPPALVELTDGQLPAAVVRQARAWKFGPGTLVIHLALSGQLEWKAGDSARRSFYIHVGPSLNYLAAAYQQGMAGLLSTEPFFVVGQPTRYDPSRAPAGKHVLWVMVRAVPAVIRDDVAGTIRGPDWTPAVKEAFADRVLGVLESHAPGLRGKVLGRAVHSPTDMERLNPNLAGGDLNAGSQHLSQFYGRRPFPGYAGYRMPIPGLYMCGAATWPGGGASPGSGVLLARLLLAEKKAGSGG